MALLEKLSDFQELLDKYSDDLIGFIYLLKGQNYSPTHREMGFLCRVKCPGSRVQDPSMHEYSPIVALWHFLFKPKSLYLHVTPSSKKTILFMAGIKLLIVVLKATKYAWLTEFIEIKGNTISIKGYSDWWITAKCGKNPANFIGYSRNYDLMVWVDDHDKIPASTKMALKDSMNGYADRMVLA